MLSFLPIALQSLIVCSLSVTIAIVIFLLIRRRHPLSLFKEHHDIAGFTFGVIGVTYAVLVAFLVIATWDDFKEAEHNCVKEANALGDIYRDSYSFPEKAGAKIRTALINYGSYVIEDEWPIMAKGKEKYSKKAWGELNGIWRLYREFSPDNDYEKIWYAESISRLNAMMDYRRTRLNANIDTMHPLMNFFLIVGGMITISFMYFFGSANLKAQILMIAALTALISFLLFLIFAIENPFRGDISIRPEAMKQVIERAPLIR
jgi:hypothetical protein